MAAGRPIHNAPEFAGDRRFAVHERLGSGSMCVVYRVLDQQHGDVVALKTLRHLDSNSLYRLKQEFRALSSFDHPNLVSFYELIRNDQGWFVTMELVEGVDFLTFVRGQHEGEQSRQRSLSASAWASGDGSGATLGRADEVTEEADLRFHGSVPAGGAAGAHTPRTFMPTAAGAPTDMVRLRSSLRQLAEGVAELHSVGRVHRDLKPSNVLVTRAGRVVILDFGLVAEIDQDYTEGTLHQNIAGSAAYMSPEQSVGRPLSEASDWYSVGVMLYEALTGVWPYVGHLYQILTAKQQRDPVPPGEVVAGVPDDLNQLCVALLQRDPDQRPTGAEVLGRLKGVEVRDAPRSLKARFRFRDHQVTALMKAFQTARWGRTVVTLVRGGPGTGKSALVREFVKAVKRRDEVTTLKGRCYEWEKVPFKALDAVVDNLARVLRRMDAKTVLDFTGDHLSYLGALFPVLHRVDLGADPIDVDQLPEDELRRRAFDGLRRLFRSLCAQQPVVLHIDDVHWGDTESAEVLGELIRSERQLSLHVVLSYRSDEPAAFIHWLLPTLTQSNVDLRIVDLEPLDFESACSLAAELLDRSPDDPDARRAALESSGNPALLRDLCRAAVLQAGRRATDGVLTEVLVARVGGLPDDLRRLLELLATLNRPVSTDFAIHVGQLGGDAFNSITTLRALELVESVVSNAGESLEVPCEALREYVYERMPEARRSELHLAVAHALEADRVDDTEALVQHYAAAGHQERAGLLAWLGAQRALTARRFDEAVGLLDRALVLGTWSQRERRSMLGLQGDALAQLGRGEAAARSYELAVEEGVPLAARRMRIQQAAEQLLVSGHVEEGLSRLRGLIADLGMPSLGGRFEGGFERVRRFRLRMRGTEFDSKRPEQVDPELLLRVDVAWTASAALGLVDPRAAARYQSVHLATALEVGERERVVRALANELPRLAASDPSGQAWRARYEEVLAVARRAGSPVGMGRLAGAAARAAFIEGRFEEASELARQAEGVLVESGSAAGWETFQVRLLRMRACIAKGELRVAAGQLETLTQEAMRSSNLLYATDLMALARAPLRLAEGDADTAAEELAEAYERWSHGGPFIQHVWILTARARVDLYRSRPGVGRARLLAALPELERSGLLHAPQVRADVDRVRAACALALASANTDAAAMLREAEGIGKRLAKFRFLWVLPWSELILAAVDFRRGADPAARLHRARDDFARSDMWLGAAVAGRQAALPAAGGDPVAVERAESWLAQQGVRDIERLCATLGPGFEPRG